MNIRKRRSDRSGRVRLFSPGRPPVAGREERRRFWAAIAAGTASEDAAVGVGVPQAVGTRWFRKAGGMPPSMFGLSAKPPLWSASLVCGAGGDRLPSRSGAARCRRSLCGSGEWHRQSPKSCGATPREGGGLEYRCDDSAMARRARCSPPKAGEACAQRGVKNLCRGTVGWRRCGSGRGSCSSPGRVLEKPSARTTKEGPAMGKRLEPGADRPSPAGGLRGRRDHAHQP